MRIALLLATLLSCTAPLELHHYPNTGTVQNLRYRFEPTDQLMPYSLYVPTSYDGSKRFPVIFALHGLYSHCWQVINYPGFVDSAEKHGYILVAPTGFNDRGWYGMYGPTHPKSEPNNLGELSERDVLNVITLIRDEFNIDSRRIYLYGHSMGGGGAFHLLAKYPEQFAAIATVAPAYFVEGRSTRLADSHSAILVIQGEKDRMVDVKGTRSLVEELEDNGHDV
ncbi:MAG: alpha/beta fold hydrolase, partial [Planctomycetota bacterium]|nr:alpha/beta fold hydrolase [Planctomycetota bacterium]